MCNTTKKVENIIQLFKLDILYTCVEKQLNGDLIRMLKLKICSSN